MKVVTYIVLGSLLFLTACNTTQPSPIVRQFIVVEVPPSIYNQCKEVRLNHLDPTNLTNEQVSELIVTLKSMNRKCVNTIAAIKSFLAKAKVDLEKQT